MTIAKQKKEYKKMKVTLDPSTIDPVLVDENNSEEIIEKLKLFEVRYDSIRSKIKRQRFNSLQDLLEKQMYESSWKSLSNAIYSSEWSKIRESMWASIQHSLFSQMYEKIFDLMSFSLKSLASNRRADGYA